MYVCTCDALASKKGSCYYVSLREGVQSDKLVSGSILLWCSRIDRCEGAGGDGLWRENPAAVKSRTSYVRTDLA